MRMHNNIPGWIAMMNGMSMRGAVAACLWVMGLSAAGAAQQPPDWVNRDFVKARPYQGQVGYYSKDVLAGAGSDKVDFTDLTAVNPPMVLVQGSPPVHFIASTVRSLCRQQRYQITKVVFLGEGRQEISGVNAAQLRGSNTGLVSMRNDSATAQGARHHCHLVEVR